MIRRRAELTAATLVAALALVACSSTDAQRTAPTTTTGAATATAAAGGGSAASAVPAPRRSTPTSLPSSPVPTGPCATAKAQRAVIVEVRAQHLWMCDGHRTVRDTAVTTGAVDQPYDSTPLGTFHVQARDRNQTLNLLSGAQYTVKYWIPFDAPLFGFHDSPWQQMAYGSQGYRTKGSHGCVHMPLASIKFLYGWAHVGTTVSIRR